VKTAGFEQQSNAEMLLHALDLRGEQVEHLDVIRNGKAKASLGVGHGTAHRREAAEVLAVPLERERLVQSADDVEQRLVERHVARQRESDPVAGRTPTVGIALKLLYRSGELMEALRAA
jgi:hypothetical protein